MISPCEIWDGIEKERAIKEKERSKKREIERKKGRNKERKGLNIHLPPPSNVRPRTSRISVGNSFSRYGVQHCGDDRG